MSDGVAKGSSGLRVREEQVALLYSFPQRVIGNAINAAIVAAVIWARVDTILLISWLGLHVIAAAARVAIGLAYRRRASGSDVERWALYFLIGSAATGALWGAAASIVWLSPDIVDHVFIAFVIAGTVSAAATMSYPQLAAFYAFGGFAAIPLALGFLLMGDAMHLAMGFMTLLMLVLMAGQARVAHVTMMRTFRLQEENRALVADLSAARDNLELRVRERTAQLDAANTSLRAEMAARLDTESRLQQLHKMEAIGQLTGGIAHDFNNLLAVIQGNSELLAEQLKDDVPRREIQAILRASARGAQLTQRLLAFSRKQALQPQAIDVNELLASMTDMLGRTLGGDVTVSVQPDMALPPAQVDPGQLENAILNLAINARDAMPRGGTLTISSHSVYLSGGEGGMISADGADAIKSGRYVVVEVHDTGVGIPKDCLDRVWEPFFTTKRQGEGTGLGLSMVYGFVRQSGGQVAIESIEGKGTTVRLFLPCADGVEAVRAEREDLTGVPPGKEYILVIDDDREILSMVDKYFSRLGYRIVTASSAEETFEKLASHGKPDMILSDVLLPGGNRGPIIVANARKSLGPIKVVFMSGHAAQGFADVLGPDERVKLVNKPFELAELARIVRGALDRTGD